MYHLLPFFSSKLVKKALKLYLIFKEDHLT